MEKIKHYYILVILLVAYGVSRYAIESAIDAFIKQHLKSKYIFGIWFLTGHF